MQIDRDLAKEVVGSCSAKKTRRQLLGRRSRSRLRGNPERLKDPRERRKILAYLVRQGFSASRGIGCHPQKQSQDGPSKFMPRVHSNRHNDLERDSRVVSRVFRAERPSRRAQLVARPARRSVAALHQRRDEPVQGRVPRQRAARLQARGELPEVHARQRQAQRPRERRTVAEPSHVLPDARQLLVRRLLQERGDRVRLGAADRRVEHSGGQALRHGLQG